MYFNLVQAMTLRQKIEIVFWSLIPFVIGAAVLVANAKKSVGAKHWFVSVAVFAAITLAMMYVVPKNPCASDDRFATAPSWHKQEVLPFVDAGTFRTRSVTRSSKAPIAGTLTLSRPGPSHLTYVLRLESGQERRGEYLADAEGFVYRIARETVLRNSGESVHISRATRVDDDVCTTEGHGTVADGDGHHTTCFTTTIRSEGENAWSFVLLDESSGEIIEETTW